MSTKKNKSDDESSDSQSSIANTRALTTRFFQVVMGRQFSEAERILEKIKTKMRKNEWNRGYICALNGMLLAQKSSEEKYTYLTNIDLNDEEALRKSRRDFLNHVKSDFHADYDRGFFSAWADFVKTVLNAREKAKLADKTG